MKNLSNIEEKIGIRFKDKNVLKRAFVHRSYLNEASENGLRSNERLEFLGDAVLEFVSSEYLFLKYPDFAEGKLTSIRSILVCTRTLAEVADELDLGEYLFLSKGEEEGEGRNKKGLLANTVESLIGAIYIDGGFEKAADFINKWILAKADQVVSEGLTFDFKSKFQEKVQAVVKKSPEYKIISSSGPDHKKKFKVGVYVDNELTGSGEGNSKQNAEQEAAKTGLENWGNLE